MYNRREYLTTEQIHCGFKATGALADAINKAAEKAKAPSKSDYLKRLVADWVAAELAVPVETLLDPQENTSSAAQQEAAIAVARLQQTIADAHVALKAVQAQAIPRRTRHQSGMQRKAG
jgi:hypothetical protein